MPLTLPVYRCSPARGCELGRVVTVDGKHYLAGRRFVRAVDETGPHEEWQPYKALVPPGVTGPVGPDGTVLLGCEHLTTTLHLGVVRHDIQTRRRVNILRAMDAATL